MATSNRTLVGAAASGIDQTGEAPALVLNGDHLTHVCDLLQAALGALADNADADGAKATICAARDFLLTHERDPGGEPGAAGSADGKRDKRPPAIELAYEIAGLARFARAGLDAGDDDPGFEIEAGQALRGMLASIHELAQEVAGSLCDSIEQLRWPVAP